MGIGLKPGMAAGHGIVQAGPQVHDAAAKVAASNAFGTLTAPPGRLVGDRLLVACVLNATGGFLSNTITGWTPFLVLSSGPAAGYRSQYYYRTADGTSADNFTPTGPTGLTSTNGGAYMVALDPAGTMTLGSPAATGSAASGPNAGAGLNTVSFPGPGYAVVMAFLLASGTSPTPAFAASTPGVKDSAGVSATFYLRNSTLDATAVMVGSLWVSTYKFPTGAAIDNGGITSPSGSLSLFHTGAMLAIT